MMTLVPEQASKPLSASSGNYKARHGNAAAVYSTVAPPVLDHHPHGERRRLKTNGQSPLVSCVKEDGKYHKLHSCLKFKALSVQERLQKAKERGLYFRCFGRHWLSRCRSTKLCGVNGCTTLHHEQLHSLKFQSATTPQAFHLTQSSLSEPLQ